MQNSTATRHGQRALRLVGLCALGIVAACGLQLRRDLPLYASGSRLEHHGWSSGDAVTYRYTVDSQLQVRCSFARAEDGETRCLPESAPLNTANHFSSADCDETSRLVATNAPDTYRFTRLPVETETCDEERWAVDQLTPVSVGETVYFLEGETCRAQQANFESYYSPTHRDPSDFVLVTSETRVDRHGLGVEVWVGSDDSYLLRGSWDRRYGPVSLLELAAPMGERLVPSVGATEGANYSDASCELHTYAVPVCQGDSVGVLLDTAPDDIHPTALRPGPQLGEGEVFDDFDEGSGCRPTASESFEYSVFFAAGEPFENNDLGSVEHTLVGEGAVQQRVLTGESGDVVGLDDPPFAAGGLPCRPIQTLGSGQALCVDANALTVTASAGVFADAECIKSPLLYAGEENADVREGMLVVEPVSPPESDDRHTLWLVDERYSGTLYVMSPLGCVAQGDAGPTSEPFWKLSPADTGMFETLEATAL